MRQIRTALFISADHIFRTKNLTGKRFPTFYVSHCMVYLFSFCTYNILKPVIEISHIGEDTVTFCAITLVCKGKGNNACKNPALITRLHQISTAAITVTHIAYIGYLKVRKIIKIDK